MARARRARAAAAAALLAGALAIAGCTPSAPGSATTATASTPTALPAGVDVTLVQLRSDVAARQAQVEVRNGTGYPLQIGDVAVADPRFAGEATRVLDRVTIVPPGRTVDIRVQLPAMDCDVAEGASTVRLTLIGDSEVVAEGPIPDKLDLLPPLHARECRAQALADAAAVTLGEFTPSPPGVDADLVLEIQPTGDAAARIAAIQSTNLLTFGDMAAGGFPIGRVIERGDTTPASVTLPLRPIRCDPHAVQEDKRGTVFNVEVELDGESGVVQVAASEELRARILTWVANWCGFGPG